MNWLDFACGFVTAAAIAGLFEQRLRKHTAERYFRLGAISHSMGLVKIIGGQVEKGKTEL